MTIRAPRSSLPHGTSLSASAGAPPTRDLPGQITPVGQVLQVDVKGGVLRGAVEVEFPVPEEVDGVDRWPVVVWEDRAGSFSWRPTSWAPGQRTAVATVEHFSRGFLGAFDVAATAKQWAANATNYFTGRFGVSPPTCGDEAAARTREVEVVSDSGDGVKWCFGILDGRRVLRVANNKRSYVEMSFPSTWKVVDAGALGISLGAVNRLVADAAAEAVAPGGSEVRLVAGGDTLELELPAGASGVAHVEMSVTSYLLSAIQFGADVYAFVASLASKSIGSAAKLSWQRIVKRLSGIESMGAWGDAARECLRSLTDEVTDRPLDAELSATIGALTKFVWRCVPEMMKADLEAAGATAGLFASILISTIGTVVGLVLTAINLIVGGLREAYDLIASLGGESDALYDIAIGAPLPDTTVLRQPEQPLVPGAPAVVVVADVSGSMAQRDSLDRVKIEAARSSILDFIAGVEEGTRFGLRTYPAGSGGCDSGQVRVPLGTLDATRSAAIVRTLAPGGDTPTAEALLAAARDLQDAGAPDGAIVLVSDGESTCGDPCAVASEIRSAGLDIQVHTVALAVGDDARKELSCIAESTGGKAAIAGDTNQLAAILKELSQPSLSLDLDYPSRVTAEVGSAAGLTQIVAAIENTSTLAAIDVRARIEFQDGSVAVASPARSIGNLDAGSSTRVVWQFRPGIALAGKTVKFDVEVSGANLSEDAAKSGTIAVGDAGGRANAGPLLKNAKRIAILGDSYSAGEGAGTYLAGTDTPSNSCHRSSGTYLVAAFNIKADHIVACSGAVVSDITNANDDNGQVAQVLSVARLQQEEPLDAVVLTIGGNDVGFASILSSCLLAAVSCTSRVWTHETERYIDARLADLPVTLAQAYAAIDAVLNNDDALRARKRRAPVIVLSYPRIFPGADRSCLALTGFSQAELDLGSELITDLNGAIEAGVKIARGTLRANALFVDTVEDAFLPDHTVCDGPRAYARSPETIRVSPDGPTLATAAAASLTPTPADDVALASEEWSRRIQELYHPNTDGYAAVTRAVIRWSLTDDASQPPPNPKRAGLEVGSAEGELGQLDGRVSAGATLQAGGTYEVQGSGFAPFAAVDIVLESSVRTLRTTRADGDGFVAAKVVLPPVLESGRHTISLIGADPALVGRTVSYAVEVEKRGWNRRALGAGGLAVLLLGGLALRVRRDKSTRRRRRGFRSFRSQGSGAPADE